jgi:DNA-binding transcriptional MerR regulator/predicted transcriptional regulator YdeE
MYTIGEFAAIGRLSVRMLRHYDAIGLLRPAQVDEWSGYRRYAPAQLAQLTRILALKELGFPLEQVARIVHDEPDEEAMRALLTARRDAVRLELGVAGARLARIEAELRRIEGAPVMPSPQVVLKPLPAARVAALIRVVDVLDPEHISPVIGPLFQELMGVMERQGIAAAGPALAVYAPTEEYGPATVMAALPVESPVDPASGLEMRELPAVQEAATLVHHGTMATISDSWSALADWVAAHPDARPSAESREAYLSTTPFEDDAQWVTELQWPLIRG